jgi:hypothetical protein
MTIYPNGKSQPSEKGSVRHVSPTPFVADVVELLPAGGSAWVMSEFMYQMRPTTHLPDTVSLTVMFMIALAISWEVWICCTYCFREIETDVLFDVRPGRRQRAPNR